LIGPQSKAVGASKPYWWNSSTGADGWREIPSVDGHGCTRWNSRRTAGRTVSWRTLAPNRAWVASDIPTPLIEISLHFRQLFFRPLQTRALFIVCPDSAPDMFQIGPHIHENMRPPLPAAKALFAIVMPVLRSGTERQHRDDYACCKRFAS
jgi:hypothetical protein